MPLATQQWGFRSGRFTISALLDVAHKINGSSQWIGEKKSILSFLTCESF